MSVPVIYLTRDQHYTLGRALRLLADHDRTARPVVDSLLDLLATDDLAATRKANQ